MPKIGTVKVGTESGTEEVPVFEPSDVDNPIVRVQTEGGTGVLNLVDPSSAELNQLRVQTENNGTLAVSTSISTGTGGIQLTASTTLNGQTAALFIYEDTSGNGVPDNTTSVQLQDGTNTYSLSDFSGDPGNDYWIELELENSDIEKTAVIDYVEIEGVSAVATVDANIQAETTATVTVYEDTSGNGTADREQTITLEDGQNSYSLRNLTGGEGNDYWMHIELENSNLEKTAVINNIQLSV